MFNHYARIRQIILWNKKEVTKQAKTLKAAFVNANHLFHRDNKPTEREFTKEDYDIMKMSENIDKKEFYKQIAN